MNEKSQQPAAPAIRAPFFARGSDKLAVSTRVRAGAASALEECRKRE